MPALRAAAIALVSTLVFVPAPVFAQAAPPSDTSGGPPPQASSPPPPGAITRQEFVQRRADEAGRLFDKIDTSHQGYITRAQLRAFMAQRRAGRGGPPPQESQ
jgi:hypothetical protein